VTTVPLLRVAAVSACGAALLAGCGGSTTASSGSARPSPAGSSSSSASANAAVSVVLAVGDLPSAVAGFTQVSDGLLGSTPGTDARVFANGDNSTRIEVDVAVDISSTTADDDYAAYNAAAAKQVPTQTDSSTPTIGSMANEYAGTDANSHSVVSLAFVQGSVLCVVTMVSSSTAVDRAVVEATATKQAQKIGAANL
jgi:hypothetical protein